MTVLGSLAVAADEPYGKAPQKQRTLMKKYEAVQRPLRPLSGQIVAKGHATRSLRSPPAPLPQNRSTTDGRDDDFRERVAATDKTALFKEEINKIVKRVVGQGRCPFPFPGPHTWADRNPAERL